MSHSEFPTQQIAQKSFRLRAQNQKISISGVQSGPNTEAFLAFAEEVFLPEEVSLSEVEEGVPLPEARDVLAAATAVFIDRSRGSSHVEPGELGHRPRRDRLGHGLVSAVHGGNGRRPPPAAGGSRACAAAACAAVRSVALRGGGSVLR